jgi:hypothetical protein
MEKKSAEKGKGRKEGDTLAWREIHGVPKEQDDDDDDDEEEEEGEEEKVFESAAAFDQKSLYNPISIPSVLPVRSFHLQLLDQCDSSIRVQMNHFCAVCASIPSQIIFPHRMKILKR